MQTVSAGDIAAAIAEPGEALPVVRDRVRNWVKHGLLKPLGGHHPGTGRHRQFPERVLIEAALLNRLARAYGSAAPQLALFHEVLDRAVRQLPKAAGAADRGEAIYLIVWTTGSGSALRVFSDVQFVPDLSLSQPVGKSLKRSIELPPAATDGLYVDLSALFSRLGVPLADVKLLKELAKRFPGIERIRRG